jgi:Spy/CpxP family protein refolding chaperone
MNSLMLTSYTTKNIVRPQKILGSTTTEHQHHGSNGKHSHVFSVDDIEIREEQQWQIYNIAQSYFNLALPSAQNK